MVKCKKDFDNNNTLLFIKDKEYKTKIFGTMAFVFDELGCMRDLYNNKSDKLYKEYFEEIIRQ